MAHTITYEGEATVGLDAVLAYVAPSGGAGVGGWFVEVTTNDQDPDGARTVQGWVEDFHDATRADPESRVTIAETVEGESEARTGVLLVIPTAHIEHLTIP